ncbi:hypothetical protein [Butyrivibrio sp. YAB3001]|uniref:hypothetical protein n=1 Tax=Butyrivibrio sp. YAB3001 TaxID=1520812 RepID=UPI0008F628B3|nr:hypothetical protein [Butyrivibrio sp. YAB3001]SFC00670.1 hypothetical protein SAMN02910398_01294 [Butyrivibrio sp. YAB3001]
MYSEIVICLKDCADEVFEKQVNMLKERHNANVLRIEADEAADYIKTCSSDILFISDEEDILLKAKDAGLATNNPRTMRESYMKAMEMLKTMGMNGGRK